ncbi:hypothetical protein NLU13_1249 [Sarocladium strictum]|uniref:Uncharacterized protein n=1 Tax=Sarocladium strictum TaxID=5046 RepID=A0AA39GQL3_SARSR|nr:hypothetical protein NLU13_1249 [Sarocladium strictum]
MLNTRLGPTALRGPFASSVSAYTGASMLCVGRRSFQSTQFTSSSAAPQSKATKISASQGHEILTKQRLNRPIAPHLEVYRLSQTYLGSSAWMRITGSSLLGVGYIYFGAYLLSPLVGVDMGSASVASAFAELPGAVKMGIKMLLAWPFSFHFCNGIKQLLYDSAWAYPYNKVTMSRNDVYVFVVSTAVALGLVFGF